MRAGRSLLRGLTVALLAVVLAGCGQVTSSIGPLTLDVPDGWSVTSRGGNNLQVADGTTGGATGSEAGTATAVFDVYVESAFDHEEYAEQLRADNVAVRVEREIYGGVEAYVLSYSSEATGGSQMVVAFPEPRIHMVYRAAFPSDDAAFLAGRSAFLRAVRSVTFAS